MNGDVGLLEPDDHGMGTQHVNAVKEFRETKSVTEFLNLLSAGWMVIANHHDDHKFILVRV